MQNLLKVSLVISWWLLLPIANAVDFSVAEQEFVDTYQTHFEQRYCGKNIQSYIHRLNDLGIPMQEIFLVKITNKGGSVFGMVNAERARGSAFDKPAVVEQNWHHHVIAIDSSSNVYDFSFDVVPRVLPFVEYVEQMYLEEEECVSGRRYGEFCAGREQKLADYEVKLYQGDRVLYANEDDPHWVGSLDEAMRKFSR